MQSDQGRDELGRYAVEIEAELAHSDVATQVAFVHTAKWAQDIADGRPHAFHRVGVHFADAIANMVFMCRLMSKSELDLPPRQWHS